jgi:hypothetical protein
MAPAIAAAEPPAGEGVGAAMADSQSVMLESA